MDRYLALFTLTACSIVVSGCRSQTASAVAPGGAPPPPVVEVVAVNHETVDIYNDYAAQTYARDLVEVRGRVDGYIEKRLFQIGSDVRAGQALYELDKRPYEAEVAKAKGDVAQAEANVEFASKQVALIQAQADLAQAQANRVKAKQDVDRLTPLVKEDAAAQQDLDNAIAALQANDANVKAREANVEQNRLSTRSQIATTQGQLESNRALLRTAELNLGYASIVAPVSGRIGDSLIQVGGLVSRTATQPLTTIVPLDPIWVRFKVSEPEVLRYYRLPVGERRDHAKLKLLLADGSLYGPEGRIENSTNAVDPKTGTLEIQATFPNPGKLLLPGQFGRVRLQTDQRKDALLIPQRAVQELQGLQSVLTVGPDNKVLARSVSTGERVGDRWVVLQGLKVGDRVIVEGLQKARPGSVVQPKPYQQKPSKNNGLEG